MNLPPEILAFKLLRKANLTREEHSIILTGMNLKTGPHFMMMQRNQ